MVTYIETWLEQWQIIVGTIGNDRQCELTDNGEWHTMANYRHWGMTYKFEWQTLENGQHWIITYNGQLQTIGIDNGHVIQFG